MDDVQHTRAGPGPEALGELLGPIEKSKIVAQKLGDELRALPVPDTDASRKAASYAENYPRLAFERMVTEERRVQKLPDNVTLLQSIRGLDNLEFALFDAFVHATSGEDTIRTQIPELREAFDKADSCKELDALGTD